jgi:hypothetical protein
MEVLSLIVNLLMATLLLVTIGYCRRLSKRIRLLQDSRSELAKIVREFDESTQRATLSIAEIHEATRRLSENIQHKIDKANFLASDLEVMIERGNKMAGRPSEAPTRVAAREPIAPALASSRAELEKLHNVDIKEGEPAPRRSARLRSKAEQELMSVLKTKGESGR